MRAQIDVVEELGNERHLMFKVDAPPVVTDAVRAAHEATSDEDATLLDDDQRAQFIAIVPGRSDPKAGDIVDLALDPEAIHLFDPATGETLTGRAYRATDETSSSRATTTGAEEQSTAA